jgi:zinc transport system substrate-binding protein
LLKFTTKRAAVIAIGAFATFATQALAQTSTSATTHTQSHANHDHEPSLVNAADVQARDLSDWENDWQSIYPFLQDGTLDAVLAHKAEDGDKTVEEYRSYYNTGYTTDVERILIVGSSVTFFRDGQPVQGQYENDGYEILTYESGNQGVRYIYEKSSGDETAPQFIQFSDHIIVPTNSDHYHLYWGNDREALLTEVTNWPTYFPANMSGADIAQSMIAH